jgi:hypothetical protein
MLIAFLLIVTFAALALSAGLLTYVLRLTREERDRSGARRISDLALGGVKPLEPWSPEMTFSDPVGRTSGVKIPPRGIWIWHLPPPPAAHAAFADNPLLRAPSVDRPAAFSSMFGAQAASADPSTGDVRPACRADSGAAVGVLVVAPR